MTIDSAFIRWQEKELVWMPERGMGHYPVTARPYDQAYFAKYQSYRTTEIGVRLNALRVDLVNAYAGAESEVVDIGIGDGAFIDARGNPTFGYDINPAAVAWLRERRLYRNPYEDSANALTFWDSIEHIHDPGPFLAGAGRWVFISAPIVPGHGPPRPSWKHYRPDEHCWYWTRMGLVRWMAAHSFECVHQSTMEETVGREDIGTFVFRRRGA